MTAPARGKGFTLLEVVVVIALLGLVSVAAILNLSDVRVATSLNEATRNILNTVEEARQFSASGKELSSDLFPSYGVSFDTNQPRDIILFADCLLDDNDDQEITEQDNFTFNPAGTQCNGGNGSVEQVRISDDPRVMITAVRSVTAATEPRTDASIVYVRPDPTTWITADSTVFSYGRLEVVVSDSDGGRQRTIEFWTSGHTNVQ